MTEKDFEFQKAGYRTWVMRLSYSGASITAEDWRIELQVAVAASNWAVFDFVRMFQLDEFYLLGNYLYGTFINSKTSVSVASVYAYILKIQESDGTIVQAQR